MLKNGWTKDEYDAIPKIPLKSVIGDGFFRRENNSNLYDLEERLQARLDLSKSDVDSASISRNRREKELELLAEVRDIKRKRQSYRVYKEIKSQTEIHREIISHQMEMLRDLDKVQRQIDGMSDEEKQNRKKHSKNKKHKDKKSKHSKSKKRKSKHKNRFDE